MAHFAELDENNEVIRVLVVSQKLINSGSLGDTNNWIKTSYNTRFGKYRHNGDKKNDDKKAFRKNFAGIGSSYDKNRDAFIPKKSFPSWVLNEETCIWDAPIPMPDDGESYKWDEGSLSWILI